MLWTSLTAIPLPMLSKGLALWLVLVAVAGITAAAYADSDESDLPAQNQGSKTVFGGCPKCIEATTPEQKLEFHNLRIESAKQQILSKLGLNKRPKVSSTIPKQVLLDTLQTSSEGRRALLDAESAPPKESKPFIEEDDYYAKTSEIYSFSYPGPHLNNHTLVQFKQSSEDVNSLIVNEATLWVHIKRKRKPFKFMYNPHRPRTKIWVFRLPSDPVFHDNPYGELIASLHIDNDLPSGYQLFQLNVTEAIRWWFTKQGEQLRLLIDCSGCGGDYEVVLFPNENSPDHPKVAENIKSHMPYLRISTTPRPSRRLARRALHCDKDTKTCCKQTLFISFRELGWDDWILAPKGYQADYCKGSCDSFSANPEDMATAYSHIMGEFNKVRGFQSVLQCCAPTRLSSITLFYVDESSNIVLKVVPGMKVEECGCV